jgi:hypothetical protein
MNKPFTREEWLTYLDTTWKKCLADAWQKDWDDMTKEDIIAMARRAGAHDDGFEVRFVELRYLERFAALVAAAERKRIESRPWGAGTEWIARAVEAEREACAKLCEEDKNQAMDWVSTSRPGGHFAAAIRARGEDPMPLFDDWGKDWK